MAEEQAISVLIVRVRGVAIALDTEQLAEMTDYNPDCGTETKLYHLHELLGTEAESYAHAKVLYVKPNSGGGCNTDTSTVPGERIGLVVSRAETIVEIPFDQIRPLPHLLRACCGRGGFLAVAGLAEELVLIADVRAMIGDGQESHGLHT